jgi:hypothetical protein
MTLNTKDLELLLVLVPTSTFIEAKRGAAMKNKTS